MTDNRGRRRPSRIRTFFRSNRARGAISAGATAGAGILPEFTTANTLIRVAILTAGIVFGIYTFLISQGDPEEAPDEAPAAPEADTADRAADPGSTAQPPRSSRRKALLNAPATAGVSLFGLRTARDRRRLRLRPDMLPPRLPFVGRAQQLRQLRAWHDQFGRFSRSPHAAAVLHRVPGLRGMRPPPHLRGHRIVYVYGRPGVGKSALANEFAHSLKRLYPHGQLYMNMGVAGGRRSEGDILRAFLKELGWPEEELRTERAEVEDEVIQLGKYFRAATARRRLLVVLDAARDLGQVEAVLPGGDRCAVIVTSRARIPGTEDVALRLDTPSPAEAARILQTHLTLSPGHRPHGSAPSAELIAEAAHLCGRQPMAMRAVADRATTARDGLGSVVEELKDPLHRLDRLAYGGRDIAERIGTEYGRVTPLEQVALQALTYVGAPSFTPWVLQPMLDVDLPEAAALMAGLSEVNLLDEFPTDPTEFPRYGFSPLIRLFAERELARSLSSASAEGDLLKLKGAPDRFRITCAVLAKRVLAVNDRALRAVGEPEVPERWIPAGIRNWEERVRNSARFWNRAEFVNLVDAVQAAHEGGFDAITMALCAQFGDGDVFHAFTPQVRNAYTWARSAANGTDHHQVMPAEVGCLVAGELYTEAINLLAAVRDASEPSSAVMRVRASRLVGQAEQRLGKYASAMTYLRDALKEVNRASGGLVTDELLAEARISEVLKTENESLTIPSHWRSPDQVPFPPGLTKISYTEHLVAARTARRRRDAITCREELGKASEALDNDIRQAFQLQLENILLDLECRRRLTKDQRADIIANAACLVITAAQAGAVISSAEARIALARTLLDDKRPRECHRTLDALHMDGTAKEVAPRLWAQWRRLDGEANLALGELPLAEHALAEAVSQFAVIHDSWAQADTRVALAKTQLRAAKRASAQVTLLQAIEAFEQCGDARSAQRALALLAPSAFLLMLKAVHARCRRGVARLRQSANNPAIRGVAFREVLACRPC